MQNEKYLYFIFTRTGTWLSKVIYRCTKDEYVHVSISFDPELKEMFSLGRTNIDNPFSGGLIVENLNDGIFKKFNDCKCLVYRMAISDIQYTSLNNQLDYHYRRKDIYKYNGLGLIALYFNISYTRENYYFCSEFISELLIKSNVYNPEKPINFIKPMDLLDIKEKEFVYEGYARDYRGNTYMKSKYS